MEIRISTAYETWRFPEIGVPPNHPFLFGIFPYKLTSYWGTAILGNLHMNMCTLSVERLLGATCSSYVFAPRESMCGVIKGGVDVAVLQFVAGATAQC